METTLESVGLEALDICAEILRGGLAFQRRQGFVQWLDGYPELGALSRDIAAGYGYIFRRGEKAAGFVLLSPDGEPVYDVIDGAWTTPEPYMVIHRLAFAELFLGTGLSNDAFPLMEEHGRGLGVLSVRVDTHRSNARMLHILEKHGYAPAGTVFYPHGERLAFEKAL